MRRALLPLILATTTGAAAFAQSPSDSLAGRWNFSTPLYGSCEMKGTATFGDMTSSEAALCEIVAYTYCGGVERVIVRQSCEFSITGQQVSVRSRIEEYVKTEPDVNYKADSFALSMVSRNRMIGSLISWGIRPAEFTRQATPDS